MVGKKAGLLIYGSEGFVAQNMHHWKLLKQSQGSCHRLISMLDYRKLHYQMPQKVVGSAEVPSLKYLSRLGTKDFLSYLHYGKLRMNFHPPMKIA
jgi:hypothetical protein